MGEPRSEEILEGLLYPIVIVNRQGNICFTNGSARRLLAEGLDQRLVSHVRSNPDIGPITQVHFKLPNGRDLVLKVRLGEIEWLGEKATQVKIWNVTPYLAVIQQLRKELGAQKQALEEFAAHRPETEPELAAHSETLATLRAELEKTRSEIQEETLKSAEACRAWESERTGFVSGAAALAASLEQARQQAEAEASQRRQAQADLEKAQAGASASEQAHSKLRLELEALRRDLEQLSAREEEESARIAKLLDDNTRLTQDLADRIPRESALAASRDALEEKAGALARELAAARQEAERAVSEGHARELESGQVKEKLAAQIETLQSELSAGMAEREELRREIAKQESLEKEIAALRQELAGAEQARSEWAETFEKLKGEIRGHLDALARAGEEAAEAARLMEAQRTKAAEAEERAALTAKELEQVRGELSRRMDEAQASEKARAQERVELERGAREDLKEVAAMGEPRSDETLGPYQLTECRAEGRIARVCKGVDRATGQKVAHPDRGPVRLPQRAPPRGARGAARSGLPRRVQDPHILKILDVGLQGDSYYIVHEDFGGLPLDEYVRETRPALKESLDLARAIAECVRAVHGYRLVHGDLKPQNILVARDARGRLVVKVALADLAHDAADAMISIFGELVGTPKYLSPEQIQGQSAAAGSDLFSLGVILYELFSGREPFPAESPIGYLHANVSADLLPLSAADTTIPPALSAVVERLLARSPRHRYRTAQALLDDLDRVEGKLGGAVPEPVPPGADSAFAPKPPEAALRRQSPAQCRLRGDHRHSAGDPGSRFAVIFLLALQAARPPVVHRAAPVEIVPPHRAAAAGGRRGEGLQRYGGAGENAGERGEI